MSLTVDYFKLDLPGEFMIDPVAEVPLNLMLKRDGCNSISLADK